MKVCACEFEFLSFSNLRVYYLFIYVLIRGKKIKKRKKKSPTGPYKKEATGDEGRKVSDTHCTKQLSSSEPRRCCEK